MKRFFQRSFFGRILFLWASADSAGGPAVKACGTDVGDRPSPVDSQGRHSRFYKE